MSYQVLARKWRPQTFDQIVGQEHVTTTLGNALDRERVAHAYLFAGPRGCGKTTIARLLAKALNCDQGPTASPCGSCPSCEGIAAGNFLDVLEIDAASNTGVDNIRELRENAQYQPSAGKKRVFIIDEVHMLSKGAFNALLKILEEPPPHVHFVFATTEPVRIPRTILSRCQRFDFRLFTQDELRGHLDRITQVEKVDIAEGGLQLIASLAEGSMRDALSLLDQAISSTEGPLDEEAILSLFGLVDHQAYLDLNQAVLDRNPRAALDLVQKLVASGHDVVEFARGLVSNFRDLLLLRLDPELTDRVEKPDAVRERLVEQAGRFEVADLMHLAQRAADHYVALQRAPQPRWLLETQVVEYATLESRVLLGQIMRRLEALQGDSGGADGDELRTPAKPSGDPAPRPKRSRSTRGASESAQSGSKPNQESSRQENSPKEAARIDPDSSWAAAVESEETPAEAGSGAGIEAGLREPWKRLVKRVRDEQIALGTCLVQAAPRMQGDRLALVFKPDHAFHRDQVAAKSAMAMLREAAAAEFGRGIEVEVMVREARQDEDELRSRTQAEVTPDQQQELDRRARENPHLGRLLDGLGGRDEDGV